MQTKNRIKTKTKKQAEAWKAGNAGNKSVKEIKPRLKSEFSSTKGWFHKDALIALQKPDYTKHIKGNIFVSRATSGFDRIYVIYRETADCLNIMKVRWQNMVGRQ